MEENKFILAFPSTSDKKDWLAYIDEFHRSNPESKPLDFKIGDDYENWLLAKQDEREGRNLEEGRVSSSVFFLKHEGEDRILGHISIRHSIATDFLSTVGGHIGYGIRPSERGKGYATIGLKLALEECKKLGIQKVLLTCKSSNTASRKCIERNDGKLRDKIEFRGEAFNRYDFDLEKETNMN